MTVYLLTVLALYFFDLVVFVRESLDIKNFFKTSHIYNTLKNLLAILKDLFQYPILRLSILEKGPYYAGIRVCFSLTQHLRKVNKYSIFKTLLMEIGLKMSLYRSGMI